MGTTSLRAALLSILVGLCVLTGGCVSTFKEVKLHGGGAPPAIKPNALALGKLEVADARLSESERELMARAFEFGVDKWCAEHKGLEMIKNVAKTNLPPSAILLEGTITEIEKGSAAARTWVGLGAGQERAVGEFRVLSPEGARLTSFSARKSYLGGQGIGGWDMLKLEDLVGQLGELAAETVNKWLSKARTD